MSLYKGNTLIAGGSQQTPLLSFVWADHLLSDISWLRADTFSWQAGSVYTAVYSHLTSDISGKSLQSETIGGTTIQFYLADDGHKICPASEENNVSAIYSATGVAWYYILDTVNTRFKLPRTQFGFTGLRDSVGAYVEAGLPNIKANGYLTGIEDKSGAANNMTSIAVNSMSVGGGAWYRGVGTVNAFDASFSNPIYGNSTTVQPKATQMYLYFYVGQFTQTAISQTAGLNAELFNGKVDKGHQVIEFQAPTADNNYTWYRKYADGWVEQGGIATSGSSWYTVNLPITMADTKYSIQVTPQDNDYVATCRTSNDQSTTSFKTIHQSSTGTCYSGKKDYWTVSGMYAQ